MLPESSVDDLKLAINKYKLLVTQSVENSETQRDLVTKLIQLRFQLAQATVGRSIKSITCIMCHVPSRWLKISIIVDYLVVCTCLYFCFMPYCGITLANLLEISAI